MGTYSRINHTLVPRIIVDVYCDAAKCRDLCAELIEARVVLSFALIGVGHSCSVSACGRPGVSTKSLNGQGVIAERGGKVICVAWSVRRVGVDVYRIEALGGCMSDVAL